MINKTNPFDVNGFSLLIIIVNRGKGSKIMQHALQHGAKGASCLFGKGTVQNNVLQLIEMNDVNKEIVLIVVPSKKEQDILKELNNKFHFERQNHGIAFTIPLVGLLNLKNDISCKYKNDDALSLVKNEYMALLLVVDKGKAETVIEISQNAGYYGGTIMKARGSASSLNILLDMIVEPEKEAVLMLTKAESVHKLTNLLKSELQLESENTGILIKLGVSNTIGLFESDKE